MESFKDDHRGHTIFPNASGPTTGPFVASYSAWRIESHNSYRAVVQGTVDGTFQTKEIALSVAISEAKASLDKMLDMK